MDIDEQSSLSMSSKTCVKCEVLKCSVALLQESNSNYDALKEEHELLKRQYKTLQEELTHLKFSLLCNDCQQHQEGELCQDCSERWKKC